MTTSGQKVFPRRDADGRVVSLVELLAASVLGTLTGLAVLAVVEIVLALLSLSAFGDGSGWLAVILPSLLFFDDLRAWRGHGVRFVVAIVAAVIAIIVGLAAATVANVLPPMLSGAVGAVVAVVVYCPLWFLGIRWLTGHLG